MRSAFKWVLLRVCFKLFNLIHYYKCREQFAYYYCSCILCTTHNLDKWCDENKTRKPLNSWFRGEIFQNSAAAPVWGFFVRTIWCCWYIVVQFWARRAKPKYFLSICLLFCQRYENLPRVTCHFWYVFLGLYCRHFSFHWQKPFSFFLWKHIQEKVKNCMKRWKNARNLLWFSLFMNIAHINVILKTTHNMPYWCDRNRAF